MVIIKVRFLMAGTKNGCQTAEKGIEWKNGMKEDEKTIKCRYTAPLP